MPFAPIIIVGSRYSLPLIRSIASTDRHSISLLPHSMDAIYSVSGISWQQQQQTRVERVRRYSFFSGVIRVMVHPLQRMHLYSQEMVNTPPLFFFFFCITCIPAFLTRLNDINKVTTSLWNLNIFPISIRIRLYLVAVFRNSPAEDTKRWSLVTTSHQCQILTFSRSCRRC